MIYKIKKDSMVSCSWFGIRIRIRNPDTDPEGQILPTKLDKKVNKFHFLKHWMFSFEG
jgi:hypothetical protein